MPKPKLNPKPKTTAANNRQLQINRGEIEAKNLAECLKVDFAVLHESIFPKSEKEARAKIAAAKELGILKRMETTAEILLEHEGKEALKLLSQHPSDTARGWAAFMVGKLPKLSLGKRLAQIQPFADDSHFGVREWAWMAVRAHILQNLEESMEILSGWTKHPSCRVRRFACEATRPRGVWAEHIAALKEKPEMALPILNALRADEERYVQDAVENWLNDAAKTHPLWVKKLCLEWTKKSPAPATAYIAKRAQRSLK